MPRKLFIQPILLFYFTCILGQSKQQPNIIFHPDYFEAVDHWVVLPEIGIEKMGILSCYQNAVEKCFKSEKQCS
jgi:hypothetical protein